jgi:hypothetical protein
MEIARSTALRTHRMTTLSQETRPPLPELKHAEIDQLAQLISKLGPQ